MSESDTLRDRLMELACASCGEDSTCVLALIEPQADGSNQLHTHVSLCDNCKDKVLQNFEAQLPVLSGQVTI